ncbi:hypothetical protein E4U15_003036 [Claviceps sp. LM218 group G6]|nr:hypothetical protein E4U15_003036 [Claviceps sp. LM218 group G6]
MASIIIDRQYTSPDRWIVSYHFFDSACRIGIYQQISSTDYLPSLCSRAVQAGRAWTILESFSAIMRLSRQYSLDHHPSTLYKSTQMDDVDRSSGLALGNSSLDRLMLRSRSGQRMHDL